LDSKTLNEENAGSNLLAESLVTSSMVDQDEV